MTTKQAADIIRMLLGYLKGEIEPPKQETIEEARAFEQQGYECLEMAIKSLEAWDKVQDEIKQKSDLIKRLWDNPDEYPDECPDEWYAGKCNAYGEALRIIDKHLEEVENESTDNG